MGDQGPSPLTLPAANGEPVGVMDIGPDEPPNADEVATRPEPVIAGAADARVRASGSPADRAAPGDDWSTVRRNDPCPCGSGKKFKKCHGATL